MRLESGSRLGPHEISAPICRCGSQPIPVLLAARDITEEENDAMIRSLVIGTQSARIEARC